MKRQISILLTICLIILNLCGCQNDNIQQDSGTSTITNSISVTDDKSNSENNIEEKTKLQGYIKAHYIDVGQGDSEFIEFPNGQTMLIDAGEVEYGNDIANYIKALGYNKIDYVVATHPHSDHIGGMAFVLNSFQIGKLYMPDKAHTSKTFENLIDTIENNEIDLYRAKAGKNILSDDGISVDILAPFGDSYSNLNNYSSVIKITYGRTKLLFMGDAESEVESKLLNADVSADVIKIGHHGSDTASSENFINKVSPSYAVVSAGAGNQYGHPHGKTLEILNNNNINVYRTDDVGTIVVTADGDGKITIDKKASSIKENAPPESQNLAEYCDDQIYYKTRTGECYHRDGCSSLSKSKIPITISEAKKEGLRACKRCSP